MARKVCVLIWKDLLYRRNRIIVTLLEVGLPIAYLIIANVTFDMGKLSDYDSSKSIYKPSGNTKEFECRQLIRPEYRPPNDDDRPINDEIMRDTQIIYQPKNPFLGILMDWVGCQLRIYRKAIISNTFQKSIRFRNIRVNIKFEGMNSNQESVPESLNYTLYPINSYMDTDALWESKSKTLIGSSSSWRFFDLEYQYAVDSSFLKMKSISVKTLEIRKMKVTFPGNPTLKRLSMTILIILIYLFSNVVITSTLVMEKISGAKELLLMMGIKRWEIWLSKFIDAILPLLITIPLMLVLLHVPLADKPVLFAYVSPWDFLLIFVLATISIIAFLFFLSSIFTNVLATVMVTTAFYALILAVDNIILYFSNSKLVAILKCIIPHVALMGAFDLVTEFESTEKEVKYNEKLSKHPDALTLIEILSMMVFDAVIFFILTLYLEQVNPGKYGIRKSPIFFLQKSYWISRKVENVQLDAKADMDFYEEAKGLKTGVSVQNVSKIYRRSMKDAFKAVDNVTIDFYENEITGLLGHNGAGKTTLISIICGFTTASSGRVIVNGHDVAKNTSDARKSLGLCPQHDMLFPTLTATQNIAFYGMIKGQSRKKAYQDAINILTRFRMEHMKKTKAGKLSGGQKRKVSLAIALVGDSKVIVLDEPTSGMDPEIRREIWDLLLPLRGSKTVVLTTHFMEEADALCDRIAIMDQGKMKCFATPMTLKTKYGTGYTLSIVASDLGKISKITESVKGIIKSSVFKSQNNLNVYFQVPEAEINNFPALFDNLDGKKAAREIITYSLNISTLEDVFIKVSHDQSKKHDASADDENKNKKNKYSPVLLMCCQISALFYKKLIMFRKKLVTFIFLNVVFMGLIALLRFLLFRRKANGLEGPKTKSSDLTLPYSLDVYPKSKVFISYQAGDKLAESFAGIITNFGFQAVKVDNVTTEYINVLKKDYLTFMTLLMAVEFYEDLVYFHYNEEAIRMPQIIMNLIHNAYMKANGFGNITTFVGFQYLTTYYEEYEGRRSTTTTTDAPDIKYMMECPLSQFVYIPTVIAFFFFIGILEEKSHGAKQLQLMLTPVPVYWLVHLIFDLIIFLIIVTITYVIYGYANEDAFLILKDRGNLIIPSLLLWSINLILFYHALTTIFSSLAGLFIFGIMFFLIAFLLALLDFSKDRILRKFSYIHPTMIEDWVIDDICKLNEASATVNLGIYSAVLFIYLILVDTKIIQMIVHKSLTWISHLNYPLEYRKDTAVDFEEEKVKKIIRERELSSKVLVVKNLKRWFFNKCKKFKAVRGISFSVNHGECFGLLGVNGAGKTSTFNMLVGELVPSRGRAYVDGISSINIFTRGAALSKIGYCPQFGGFIPCFSCTQNLIFFAKLRGIRHTLVKAEVKKWIEKMNLKEHKKKRCLELSGGNQRKLATAIALIGDPPLLFLDEPTTGVDPAGRRFIWNQISELREKGQSIVLTSHSMDECEALCSRLTIMVKGQLCCIGETAVLKETFGQGYSVLFKISIDATDEDREKLKKEIAAQFDPGCNLSDEHLSTLQYHITNPAITWKKLFGKLSDIQKKFKILESYSASATTLEQIFLYFARI